MADCYGTGQRKDFSAPLGFRPAEGGLLQTPNSWQTPMTKALSTDHDFYKPETILIVDNDVAAAQSVGEYLAQYNYRIRYESDSNRAIHRILEECPSLVLLDVLMNGIDGLSICRQVRDQYPNPILMLTGLQEDADIVTGLEIGADAYLIKPIRPRVLLAHVRAHLRCNTTKRHHVQNELHIICGEIEIDIKKRAVFKAGREIELTNAEYDLLSYLARRRGTVVPRNEIYKNLRKLEYNGVDRGIDLRISRLRKKLDDDPKCPQLIKTVRGVGYLFAG